MGNYVIRQRGSILPLVLMGMGALATVAYMASTILYPMLISVQSATQNTEDRQLLERAAYTLAAEADLSGNYPVAAAVSTCGSAITGGGCINTASAAPKKDSRGWPIGLCVQTATAESSAVLAVVSAGYNKEFSTNCTSALAGTASGDDLVITKTAAEIRQIAGGTRSVGAPVANLAALEALPTVFPGELRVALDSGYVYVNKSGIPGAGKWSVHAGGGIPPGVDRTCEAGYVPVSAYSLPDGTYVPSFCVFQYEAHFVASFGWTGDVGRFGNAVSNGAQYDNAVAACQSIGAKIISDEEWLSIAHQAAIVPSNWSGGSVGSGYMARGWSANSSSVPADPWTNTVQAGVHDASCMYNIGPNQCGSTGDIKFRRTLNLSNGAVIWDFGGNMSEWTSGVLPVGSLIKRAATSASYAYNTTQNDGSGVAVTATEMPINWLPPNGWNAAQGMGRYYEIGTTDAATGAYVFFSQPPYNCTGFCEPVAHFVRGGAFSSGPNGGIFNLNLYYGRGAGLTFRCTK